MTISTKRDIPPPNGLRTRDGVYYFFLADLAGDGKTGRTLPEEQYVAAYLERLTQLPRCADPRCHQPLDPVRGDQRYCNTTCHNRHRARQYYREANGLPPDAPPRAADGDHDRTADVRAAVLIAKAQIDRRPDRVPSRLDDGSYRPGVAPEAALPRAPIDAFLRDMTRAGYPLSDFWDEGFDALFSAYVDNGHALPARAVIEGWRDQEKYEQRLLQEAERRAREDAARARCAKLFPSMDQVQPDGGLRA